MIGGRYNYGNKGVYGNFKENQNPNIYIGIIVEDSDENNTGNLKIRIKGVDDNVPDSDLPNSFPILPKFINVYPKIGEAVFVFTFTSIKKDRLWLGPITSQNQSLRYNDGLTNGLSGFDFGNVAPKKNYLSSPENVNSYASKGKIAIQGRVNSDIILDNHNITLRSGKIDLNDSKYIKFNKDNPSYIQVRHSVNFIDDKNIELKNQGCINVVSNKINLLTYKSKLKNYDLTNQNDYISEKVLNDIINESQEIVYGRNLVNFLKIFIKAFIDHVHPFHGDLPENLDNQSSIDKLLEFDLNTILNPNVRSN